MSCARYVRLLCFAASALAVGPAAADAAAEVREALAGGRAAAALQRAEAAQVGAFARDPTLRFLQGLALMDLGREPEALALFGQLAEAYPELADPWNNMAVLQARAGDLAAARVALDAALRADPRHRLARANLAHLQALQAVRGWQGLAAEAPLDAPTRARLDGVRGVLESTRR